MDNIEKIFKEKTKDISFIEIKKGTSVNINGYIINPGLPLPVITDNFITQITNNAMVEGLNIEQVVDGIIYLLGTDKEFPHVEEYKDLLIAYNNRITDYIVFNAIKFMEEGNNIASGIHLRSAILLDSKNTMARFNYALILETLGKNNIEEDRVDVGKEFLLKSTNELETILEYEEGYALAYYKLGYYYRYFEQFIKAQLTWKKFLQLSMDNELLQEIREQIYLIDDNTYFEGGISYLSYNEFGKALDLFLKLLSNRKDDWNIHYLVGICYKGIEKYELAIEYFQNALELNDQEADIYNELGIIYFMQGKIVEAISIFNKGIEITTDDFRLLFNRGLGFIQLGEYNKAIEDIDRASTLNPDDDNIKNQRQELQDYLNTL